MNITTRIQITLLTLALSVPFISFGGAKSGTNDGTIHNPLSGNSNIFDFIETVITAAIQLGAIVAVVAIVYAGFLFVTAQGDEKKIATAKSVLLYTVIGIAILLGARLITDVVVGTVTDIDNASR